MMMVPGSETKQEKEARRCKDVFDAITVAIRGRGVADPNASAPTPALLKELQDAVNLESVDETQVWNILVELGWEEEKLDALAVEVKTQIINDLRSISYK